MQDKLYHNDLDNSIQPYDSRYGLENIEPYRPGNLSYNPQNHNQVTFNPTINIRVDASDQSNREEQHKYSYSVPQTPQRLSQSSDDSLRWQSTFFLMALAVAIVAIIGGFQND